MDKEKNEFADVENDFPEAANNEVSGEESSLITSKAQKEFDFNLAPDSNKAPPRERLDGKTVTIEDCKLLLPSDSQNWEWTKAKDKQFKFANFKLFYSGGQQEFFSGIRCFRADKNSEKYGMPTFPTSKNTDAKAKISQITQLFFAYCTFKKKAPEEVSQKEFYSFLKTKPKAVIKSVEIENPVTGEKIFKNLVDKFIN